ncbi:unnamed protein product [Closterium sp. Yama58-4]|nr:unnamed protein product [Closterium sp. Yama58-4]
MRAISSFSLVGTPPASPFPHHLPRSKIRLCLLVPVTRRSAQQHTLSKPFLPTGDGHVRLTRHGQGPRLITSAVRRYQRACMVPWPCDQFLGCLSPHGLYRHLGGLKGRPSRAQGQDSDSDSALQQRLVTGYDDDGMIWNCPIASHPSGELSMAAVEGNVACEDVARVDANVLGTFVGIFDGHGGAQAARFSADHLLPDLQGALVDECCGRASDSACAASTARALSSAAAAAAAAHAHASSTAAVHHSFNQIESNFLEIVRCKWRQVPQYAAVGTCAIVAFVPPQGSVLVVASLGDSRAVVGVRRGVMGAVRPLVVSTEHNANSAEERAAVQRLHPEDKGIVVQRSGVWRVKGIIQVTRSLGDFYLKHNEFQRDPLYARFRLDRPLRRPALLAEPAVEVLQLAPAHRFLVMATDGLWEHVSDSEAVKLVHSKPRSGVARQLVRLAITRAARKLGLSLPELKMLDPKQRRMVHDDITVVVLFLDAHRRADGGKPGGGRGGGGGPGAGGGEAGACGLVGGGRRLSENGEASGSGNVGGGAGGAVGAGGGGSGDGSGGFLGVAGGMTLRSYEDVDMPVFPQPGLEKD